MMSLYFSTRSLEHDRMIRVRANLKLTNAMSNTLKTVSLIVAWDKIVGPIGLIGSDKVGIVNGAIRLDLPEAWSDLALKIRIEDLIAVHCRYNWAPRDLPWSSTRYCVD